MDGPFYRSSWGSSPCYSANFRGSTPSRKPKVVSIPVHFIQPESGNCCRPESRADCAVKIQKVWRGFRVRKNVKKIVAIKRELDAVDRSVMERETVEAIRRDEKERLKVSEGVMSLLLRLDSIGGFDCAVRELRRSVTRRAIMLQEKIDSIIAGADNSTDELRKTECEDQRSDAEEIGDKPDLQPDLETGEPYQDPETCEVSSSIEAKSEGSLSAKLDCETEASPCEFEGDLDWKRGEEEELGVEEREIGVVQEVKSGGIEEGKRSREVLEKMVEENNKLMALMADLHEKSEMQTQILSSLSQRVEQLENAFACEKLRRAKKVKKSRHSQCFGRRA